MSISLSESKCSRFASQQNSITRTVIAYFASVKTDDSYFLCINLRYDGYEIIEPYGLRSGLDPNPNLLGWLQKRSNL